MNPIRFIYTKLKNPVAREGYVRRVSLVCHLMGVESLRGHVNGQSVYLSSQDNWGIRKFYFSRQFDRFYIQQLEKILISNPEFIFWDIGANYGAYALSLSAYAALTVVVEPSSRTFYHLSKSCGESNARIVLEHCAAGKENREGLLHLSDHHSGDHRTYNPPDENRKKTERITVRTLDAIARSRFNSLPRHNLIKIDVQGDESHVLKGAEQLIRGSQSLYILIEMWPKGLRQTGGSLDELVNICDEYGLKPLDSSGNLTGWEESTSPLDASGEDARWVNVLLKR